MKKQHNELIKILAEDKEWQTAKTLAMKLNVSERSVKNYIAEINQPVSYTHLTLPTN